nr:hypothetical protein CFP56_22351 [Quercus suber]
MRIFPNPFLGIHPDFQAPPPGIRFTDARPISGYFSYSAALSGLVGLAVTRIFRSPRLIRPVNYAVLGCSMVYPATSIYAYSRLYNTVGDAMRSEGKEPPSPLLKIDRLDHWDPENSTLLCCIAGYGLLASLRRPLYLRLLAAGLGGYVGSIVHGSLALSSMSPGQREQWKTYMSERRNDSQKWIERAALFQSVYVVQEAMKVPVLEAWAQSKKALIPAHEKVGCDLESWPDSGDAPHVFVEEDGTFLPQTRYNWNPAPQTAISELQNHIKALQETRQSLAQESEVLYAWLAQKEKEYYNCTSGRDSDDCTEKRRAAETLGAFHNDLWRTVSDHDWMILDAKKRVEQYRVMASSSTGQLEASPPALSSDASATEPTETLQLLENVLDEIQRRKAEIDEFKQTSPQMFAAVDALRDEISPQELNRRAKDAMQSAQLDERVIRELIADAKARRFQG